jgi:hypothetical protein
MIFDLPTNQPYGEPLVTRLTYPNAGVNLEGQFRLNEFAVLPPEHLEFLRLYIKVRGNLKEVERILGLSYPTIRSRFEGLLRALGYEAASDESDQKDDIISALEKGEIDVNAALEKLRKA